MNRKQLSDRIGNIDDRLVQQAADMSDYVRRRRKKFLKRLVSTAAVLVLMAWYCVTSYQQNTPKEGTLVDRVRQVRQYERKA